VLADALVVETEAEFVPLYRGQPLFGDLQVFLRDQGFLLYNWSMSADVPCGRCVPPIFVPPSAK
jgi:hypothetical protein